MRKNHQSRVVGLLGVGFDNEDGHVRITRSENFQVLMGSDGSHKVLSNLCRRIEEHISSSGRVLSDYTAEEFMELMQKMT